MASFASTSSTVLSSPSWKPTVKLHRSGSMELNLKYTASSSSGQSVSAADELEKILSDVEALRLSTTTTTQQEHQDLTEDAKVDISAESLKFSETASRAVRQLEDKVSQLEREKDTVLDECSRLETTLGDISHRGPLIHDFDMNRTDPMVASSSLGSSAAEARALCAEQQVKSLLREMEAMRRESNMHAEARRRAEAKSATLKSRIEESKRTGDVKALDGPIPSYARGTESFMRKVNAWPEPPTRREAKKKTKPLRKKKGSVKGKRRKKKKKNVHEQVIEANAGNNVPFILGGSASKPSFSLYSRVQTQIHDAHAYGTGERGAMNGVLDSLRDELSCFETEYNALIASSAHPNSPATSKVLQNELQRLRSSIRMKQRQLHMVKQYASFQAPRAASRHSTPPKFSYTQRSAPAPAASSIAPRSPARSPQAYERKVRALSALRSLREELS